MTLSAATLRSKRKKGNKVWEGRKEGRKAGREGRRPFLSRKLLGRTDCGLQCTNNVAESTGSL